MLRTKIMIVLLIKMHPCQCDAIAKMLYTVNMINTSEG